MDKADLQRLRQLAVDVIVKSSVHSVEAKLAEALEKCIDEIENDSPPHCATCQCGVAK